MTSSHFDSLRDQISSSFMQGHYELAQLLYTRLYDEARASARVSAGRAESVDIDLSIIIVSYKCNDYTISLLNSLKDLKLSVSHEVIVVINNDNTLRMIAKDLLKQFTWIDSPANLGASGGRNLGAEIAAGRHLLFIDDDGETDAQSIQKLYDTLVSRQATAVRGRVVPRSSSTATVPKHYDLGRRVIPTIIDIEGITIWNGERFRRERGFNGLLYGHEGFELFSRLFKRYGPHSFLYEPNAVLIHDFSKDKSNELAKNERHNLNNGFLKWLGVLKEPLIHSMAKYKNDPLELAIFANSEQFANINVGSSLPLVSIITTAKNAGTFLPDYVQSLKSQDYTNFEVVFVDDGSTDNTQQIIGDLWEADERPLRLLSAKKGGRAGSLQEAVAEARGEYCVIADADDIMVPDRIKWTVDYFDKNPSKSCVSFYVYNEEACLRGTRPYFSSPVSLRIRRFAGMPASFPTFAFVRKRFNEPFDDALEAGIDCDWLFRNFAADASLDGDLLPIATTYYRLHAGQITQAKRDVQRDVGVNRVAELHRNYIKFDDEVDRSTLMKLMGWVPIKHGGELAALYDYIARFENQAGQVDNISLVRAYLLNLVEVLHRSVLRNDYQKVKASFESSSAKLREVDELKNSLEAERSRLKIEDEKLYAHAQHLNSSFEQQRTELLASVGKQRADLEKEAARLKEEDEKLYAYAQSMNAQFEGQKAQLASSFDELRSLREKAEAEALEIIDNAKRERAKIVEEGEASREQLAAEHRRLQTLADQIASDARKISEGKDALSMDYADFEFMKVNYKKYRGFFRRGSLNGMSVRWPDYFDEAKYLSDNPDVAAAVARGEFMHGYHHYVTLGRTEGRPRPAIRATKAT